MSWYLEKVEGLSYYRGIEELSFPTMLGDDHDKNTCFEYVVVLLEI
jgi:hypothetical protein